MRAPANTEVQATSATVPSRHANKSLPHERAHRGAIGVGLAFALVVAALLVAWRRLRRAASVERADAILAAECESISTKDPR